MPRSRNIIAAVAATGAFIAPNALAQEQGTPSPYPVVSIPEVQGGGNPTDPRLVTSPRVGTAAWLNPAIDFGRTGNLNAQGQLDAACEQINELKAGGQKGIVYLSRQSLVSHSVAPESIVSRRDQRTIQVAAGIKRMCKPGKNIRVVFRNESPKVAVADSGFMHELSVTANDRPGSYRNAVRIWRAYQKDQTSVALSSGIDNMVRKNAGVSAQIGTAPNSGRK